MLPCYTVILFVCIIPRMVQLAPVQGLLVLRVQIACFFTVNMVEFSAITICRLRPCVSNSFWQPLSGNICNFASLNVGLAWRSHTRAGDGDSCAVKLYMLGCTCTCIRFTSVSDLMWSLGACCATHIMLAWPWAVLIGRVEVS